MSEPLPAWPSGRANAVLSAALEFIERGWSVIPTSPTTKKPLIEWAEHQHRPPTEEEVERFFEPPYTNVALVTGVVSGIVVVDADDEDAIAYCYANGLSSPVSVRTRRGRHFYFKHPGPGTRVPNSANFRGVKHLDVRGDGGYVILPPSLGILDGDWKPYLWEMSADFEDMADWPGDQPTLRTVTDDFDFSSLNLQAVKPEGLSHRDATALRVKREGPLSEGDGRNVTLTSFIGELVRAGHDRPKIEAEVASFQQEFFSTELPPAEVLAIINSIAARDRAANPELYDKNTGERIQAVHQRRLIFYDDLSDIEAALDARPILIRPFLQAESIVQLYSWTGVGKSLFIRTLLWNAALGQSFGGFEVSRPCRVLYLDLENGARTLVARSRKLAAAYGNPGGMFANYSPALSQHHDAMNLQTEAGRAELQHWVSDFAPDIVVIDTIRSAFLAMEENDAKAWAPFNDLVLRLRNSGIAVIALHHANKPGSDGKEGREAGSSNQLSAVECQIKLAALYDDEIKSEQKNGRYAPEVWLGLKSQLPHGCRLNHVIELTYGKVRDMSDEHVPVQIGWYLDPHGIERVIMPSTPRQKALVMHRRGQSVAEIADKLGVFSANVTDWLAGK